MVLGVQRQVDRGEYRRLLTMAVRQSSTSQSLSSPTPGYCSGAFIEAHRYQRVHPFARCGVPLSACGKRDSGTWADGPGAGVPRRLGYGSLRRIVRPLSFSCQRTVDDCHQRAPAPWSLPGPWPKRRATRRRPGQRPGCTTRSLACVPVLSRFVGRFVYIHRS